MIDRLFDWLTTPKVARVRRWAFLVTIPAAYLLVRARGVDVGLALVAAELVIGATIWAYLLRRAGPRRAVVLDLLMHPTARRLTLTEVKVLTSIPRRIACRRRPPGRVEFPCGKRNADRWFALAIAPAVFAETVAVHLLLPDGWELARIVLLVISIYGWWWLVSLAWGPTVAPHQLSLDGQLLFRSGPLYSARASAQDVAAVDIVETTWERLGGLAIAAGSGEGAFPVGGKTDVRIAFSSPIQIERPVAAGLEVTAIHVAVDGPAHLLERLARSRS